MVTWGIPYNMVSAVQNASQNLFAYRFKEYFRPENTQLIIQSQGIDLRIVFGVFDLRIL